jgi:hypothetical protein
MYRQTKTITNVQIKKDSFEEHENDKKAMKITLQSVQAGYERFTKREENKIRANMWQCK